MEKWDAYLENGEKTGRYLTRGQWPLPDGLYHLVVEVLVQHVDGHILFMKRDINKPSYPNYFEASAGGSALAGESTEEAILREFEEETGITPLTLTFLDRNLYREDACFIERFIATTDCPKSAVRLQEEETTDYC